MISLLMSGPLLVPVPNPVQDDWEAIKFLGNTLLWTIHKIVGRRGPTGTRCWVRECSNYPNSR